jgi:hypothetical protein
MPPTVTPLDHSHLTILDIIGAPDGEASELCGQDMSIANDNPIILQDGDRFLFSVSTLDQEDSETELKILEMLQILEDCDHTVFGLRVMGTT